MEEKQEALENQSGEEQIKKGVRIIQALRGMKDILPADQKYWKLVFDKVVALASHYGFERYETPVLEEASLFNRSIGKDTDIVEKEMYIFEDLDGTKVALRPEATASLARAYIQHGLWNQPQPIKAWYWGPMFRHERPQSGRYRNFYQFGFEILGEAAPIADVIIILLAYNFYHELGVPVSIQINSIGCVECRAKYVEELTQYFRGQRSHLCEFCKKRLQRNPMRLLDCKEEQCQPVKQNAPQILDSLCDPCREHFMAVLEYLDELGLPYFLNHSLVRGLDYYTRTVFEIYAAGEEGASQAALGGGGRYDLLVSTLGGRPTPACGFAHGVERAASKIREAGRVLPLDEKKDVFIAQLGEQARRKAVVLFENCRKAGIKVAENFYKNGLRPQLEAADKLQVPYALIIGQKEVQDGTVIIRDMESGNQEIVDINKAVGEVKKKLFLS
ncbi:MAG: histidine--tRNA ligase [Candidatus Magasanikbacteria bacterium]|nr:histidine--tRNA ligase [Candidatus Magasanikbacteria bacterium]